MATINENNLIPVDATKLPEGHLAVRIGDYVHPIGISVPTGIDTNDATATAGQILEGATAYVKGHKVEGTIKDIKITNDGSTITVPKGYNRTAQTFEVGSGGGSGSSAVSGLVRLDSYQPYRPAMTAITSVTVSGFTRKPISYNEDDGDYEYRDATPWNGTYVAIDKTISTDPTKIVYKSTNEDHDCYLLYYASEYDEDSGWFFSETPSYISSSSHIGPKSSLSSGTWNQYSEYEYSENLTISKETTNLDERSMSLVVSSATYSDGTWSFGSQTNLPKAPRTVVAESGIYVSDGSGIVGGIVCGSSNIQTNHKDDLVLYFGMDEPQGASYILDSIQGAMLKPVAVEAGETHTGENVERHGGWRSVRGGQATGILEEELNLDEFSMSVTFVLHDVLSSQEYAPLFSIGDYESGVGAAITVKSRQSDTEATVDWRINAFDASYNNAGPTESVSIHYLHTAVLTYKDGVVTFYVDGDEIGSYEPFGRPEPSKYLYMFKRPDGGYRGENCATIFEVAVWRRALDYEEVIALMDYV